LVPIDHFDTAAEQNPRATAVIDGDVMLSYADLSRISHQLAPLVAGLATDAAPAPIAICGPNDYRIVATMIGIMRGGGVIAPLHVQNSTEVNLRLLQQIRPRCFFYHSSMSAQVEQLRGQATFVPRWIGLDAAVASDDTFDALTSGSAIYRGAWIDASGNARRPVYYWPTSGTTGEAKVVIEDCGTFDRALGFTRVMRGGPGIAHVSLAVTPLTHSAGAVAFGTLALGGTAVLMRPRDLNEVLKTVEQHHVTDLWLSPTVLYVLLDSSQLRRYDLSSLRTIRLGMAGVAPDRIRQAVTMLGPRITLTYGQIETGFVTTMNAATVAACVGGDHPERLRSSGTTMFVNRFAIMNEEGRQLPAGQEGEIVVRGGCVKNYLDPDATREARRFGWHHTGDIGYVDDAGYLYVTGRFKDVINMAGFKFPATEVEHVILELSDVQECAVVAVSDAIRGEVVMAAVTLRPGRSIETATIAAHCRARVGRKAPHIIEMWNDLPRSAAGKIDKLAIRRAVEGRTEDVRGSPPQRR
jgi:fatty-acyl-CoA synthase